MVGPTIQDSLYNILLRFRLHKYVLSGDIEKMFRQVSLRESDRPLQQILWRDNEDEPLKTLQLGTVTYGFASASFLTTRCIWQVGEECSDPSIKSIIQRDLYCDDLLTGADSEEQLRYIQRSVSSELAKGCFNLRKYRSNLTNLFSGNEELEKDNLLISNSTSTLGIGWIPPSDMLHFQIEYTPSKILTKRSILSSTFKIFDPLGLLSLCTIKPKIILQVLWTLKVDWDEPVPIEIHNSWSNFTKNLDSLSNLHRPRRVLIDNAVSIEMHCFCDASQRAYGTCIYLRSTNSNGDVNVSLLTAKSRVAPIQLMTIPRLELSAALLGAELSSSVSQVLHRNIDRHVYWTDSSVVLGWLKSNKKAKTFVANRVCAILELTDASSWRHVPTSENPADLVSRGVDPQHVGGSTIWWHGPAFLKESESSWPSSEFSEVVDLPELKANPAFVAEASSSSSDDKIITFTNYSKLVRLQRIFAHVLRFIDSVKDPKSQRKGPLQSNELENSLRTLIKMAQLESFPNELSLLKKGKPVPQANVASLNPFIDSEGVMRVGGRIGSSNYPYDKKHPILLKSDHHLTKLLFELEHEQLMHAGPQHLLASMRERYWPIGGRASCTSTTRHSSLFRVSSIQGSDFKQYHGESAL
ncbi:hypothetical protein JYU34_007195 [Plutella xylostella]|uniref:Uncharacterized protein n=1 Tax=Plutella xylostella TaxID=51655 RepID=A0ABQ7QPU2_PLUXY|nr:hypothetical protein JYU34_007195 [Plutella xylostella]